MFMNGIFGNPQRFISGGTRARGGGSSSEGSMLGFLLKITGMTPVHLAVFNGYISVVSFLWLEGSDRTRYSIRRRSMDVYRWSISYSRTEPIQMP